MKKNAKTLVFLGVAIIALGCAGPKIKEAVTALKPKVDDIGTKVNGQKAMLKSVADLDAKVADMVTKTAKLTPAKLKAQLAKDKDAIAKLNADIESAKGAIGQVLSMEGDLNPISDSLAVLGKKAKGDAKTAVDGLSDQVASVRASFGDFKSAMGALSTMSAKLADMQKPPVKPEPAKKAMKPAAKTGKRAAKPAAAKKK